MRWWKPKIRTATVDPERADDAAEKAAEQLAEAQQRDDEIAALTASLRAHRNGFAADVELSLRRKRPT